MTISWNNEADTKVFSYLLLRVATQVDGRAVSFVIPFMETDIQTAHLRHSYGNLGTH